MNPETSLKLWLLAAGKQFGINQAHHRRWADADTRPQQAYFTYDIKEIVPVQDGDQRQISASGYTATRTTMKEHEVTVEINLYRSNAGIYELIKAALGAQNDSSLFDFLKGEGITLLRIEKAVDLTPTHLQGDLTEHYHQQMICVFDEFIGFTLSESNAVVETVELQIDDDFATWEIDANGYRPK